MILRRLVWFLFALLGGALAFAACDAGDGSQGQAICDAGTNVYCRCPDGEAGTRACLESGEDFGECVVAPEVPCGERVQCEPFTSIACLCPDGTDGLKECLREGTGYAECKLPSGEACPEPPATTTTAGTGGSGAGGSPGTGGSNSGCAHGVCAIGAPLPASCGSCEAAVCAVDSYCCDTKWDSLCVDLADQECDNVCNPVGMCAHNVCAIGVALTQTCDTCVFSVCSADEYCCDTELGEWDADCVDAVKDGAAHPKCAGTCCSHAECSEGGKLDATCSNCASAVCNQDAFCCNNEWDELCVEKAQAEPSCNCSSG